MARESLSDPGASFLEVLGRSEAMRDVMRQVITVARTDCSVLICGETGSGKELIAKAVHQHSRRAQGPFVKVNCAAIPAGLLESELFGHERGAFTGAVARRTGRFELAQDGSLFLDEIGEMALELQPKLLRVLQEREFERLGGNRTLTSNARLVAATNRLLVNMVDRGEFREDLYYRVNVFPIVVPPLRARREDIPALAEHFLREFAGRMDKRVERISAASLSRLVSYHWPGNVRELSNVMERAVIMATGPVLEVPLDRDVRRHNPVTAESAQKSMEEVTRAHILAVLRATDWVVSGPNGAAVRLGLKRSTLNFRIKKLGIAREPRLLQQVP